MENWPKLVKISGCDSTEPFGRFLKGSYFVKFQKIHMTTSPMRSSSSWLRILAGKKHPQIKLQCLGNQLVHQINSLYEVLKLKKNSKKKKK